MVITIIFYDITIVFCELKNKPSVFFNHNWDLSLIQTRVQTDVSANLSYIRPFVLFRNGWYVHIMVHTSDYLIVSDLLLNCLNYLLLNCQKGGYGIKKMWIRPKEILNNLGMVVARTTRVSLFDVFFVATY